LDGFVLWHERLLRHNTMNVLKLYQQFAAYGNAGKWLFSNVFCYKAPYFFTIRPFVNHLEPGKAVVSMPHRFMSCNHIGTQHAIACCNLVELAMGCVVEASIPKHLRWIPRGMNVRYEAKAIGTLTATTELPDTFFELDSYPGNVQV